MQLFAVIDPITKQVTGRILEQFTGNEPLIDQSTWDSAASGKTATLTATTPAVTAQVPDLVADPTGKTMKTIIVTPLVGTYSVI